MPPENPMLIDALEWTRARKKAKDILNTFSLTKVKGLKEFGQNEEPHFLLGNNNRQIKQARIR